MKKKINKQLKNPYLRTVAGGLNTLGYCVFCGGRKLNKGKFPTGFYSPHTGEPETLEVIECENYGEKKTGFFGLYLHVIHETNRIK